MATAQKKTAAYLERLAANDLKGVLELFSKNGKVDSPLYGRLAAFNFYTQLFEDTGKSVIGSAEVFESAGDNRRCAVRYHYDWTLADGTSASFDCVDVIEFDSRWKIRELRIIYDTHPLRAAWNAG